MHADAHENTRIHGHKQVFTVNSEHYLYIYATTEIIRLTV